jgi:hypothetical protein
MVTPITIPGIFSFGLPVTTLLGHPAVVFLGGTVWAGSYVGNGSSQVINTQCPEITGVLCVDQTSFNAVLASKQSVDDFTMSNLSTDEWANNAIIAFRTNNNADFTVGTHADCNTSGRTYYYVAWGGRQVPSFVDFMPGFDIIKYIGNGVVPRTIDIGFAADLIWIQTKKPSAGPTHGPVLAASRQVRNLVGNEITALPRAWSDQQQVTVTKRYEFTSTGFIIHNNSQGLNTLNDTYYLWAWRQVGIDEIFFSGLPFVIAARYQGTNVDDRELGIGVPYVGKGWDVGLAYIIQGSPSLLTAGNPFPFRHNLHTGNNSMILSTVPFGAGGIRTDNIQAVSDSRLQVGLNSNRFFISNLPFSYAAYIWPQAPGDATPIEPPPASPDSPIFAPSATPYSIFKSQLALAQRLNNRRLR